MQLTQALHRAVASRPDGVATIHGPRRQRFVELRDRVARMAGALRALRVGTGGRVGILALNSDRCVEACLAIPWAGAVINPLNTRWSAAEIAYAIDDCDTRVLLVDDPFLPWVPELRRCSRSLATVVHLGDGPTPDGVLSLEGLIEDHAAVEDARRGGKDLAGVFYTAGTTGFPKGVMLSHEALAFNAMVLAGEGLAQPGDVGLHAAPLFHIGAQGLLHALWLVGGTHVTLPAFTPTAALQMLERERITTTMLPPSLLQLLVEHPDAAGFDLSALRALGYGGAPVAEAVQERAQRLLPRTALVQVYGMTELAPVVTLLPAAVHSAAGRQRGKWRSAGLPAPSTSTQSNSSVSRCQDSSTARIAVVL